MSNTHFFPPWNETARLTGEDGKATPESKAEPEAIAALRSQLKSWLQWLRHEAENVSGMQALLLAGGYGRGEGGVWWPDRDQPPQLYNDMEFYVFTHHLAAARLQEWIHEGEARLGIEMEFKVMTPKAFACATPSMFYYDLLKGHVCVAGVPDWIDTLPAKLSDAQAIPAEEASRLLVNRGISILRCLRWSRGAYELEAGFCDRIVAKLKMALGDAVLCIHGQYHWSCRERNKRLAQVRDTPPDWEAIVTHHQEGVAFKFSPQVKGCQAEEWEETLSYWQQIWVQTFLWLESKRLGSVFSTANDYAHYQGKVFRSEPIWKNVLRQLRDLRHSPRLPFTLSEHPRLRVWRGLLALMAHDEATAKSQLGVDANNSELEELCRRAWQRYP